MSELDRSPAGRRTPDAGRSTARLANGNTEGSADYTCNTSQNDCHVLVVERAQKRLYELYNATKTGSGFTALVAIVWDLTRAYPPTLRGDQCTSADAAGFPIAGLLPTGDEVASGEVSHALRFILPNARMKAGVYVRPATHGGAPSSSNPNAPPKASAAGSSRRSTKLPITPGSV